MKNLFLLLLCIISITRAQAQDVIVTHDNKFLEVKIEAVKEKLTFYKDSLDIEIKAISNAQIKAIQWNSKTSAQDNRQLQSIGETSDIIVDNFTLVKNDNRLSNNFLAFSAISGVFAIKEYLFSPVSEDGSLIILTLASAITFSTIGIFKRKDATYDFQHQPDIALKDQVFELRNEPLIPSKKKFHLSSANSGLGLQLNF